MTRFALYLAAAAASSLLPGVGLVDARPAVASAAAPVVMDHISITVVGSGPPLVLIPGLACPRAVWDDFVPALAASHRVLLVQVNGFGGDSPGANLKPGILDGIVTDLHAYLAKEGHAGTPVVGHSMGGLVAMMLAKSHAADVSRLLIVDSLPYFAVLMAPPGVDPTPAMVAPQAAVMRDAVAANHGKPLSAEAVEAQTRGLALKPASIARMKAWAAAADARVTAQAMYEDLTTDLRPDLTAIRTPMTVVYPWNASQPAKPTVDQFYRRQYAGAPTVRFVAIDDAAHMVMLDQPAAFATALDDFLK